MKRCPGLHRVAGALAPSDRSRPHSRGDETRFGRRRRRRAHPRRPRRPRPRRRLGHHAERDPLNRRYLDRLWPQRPPRPRRWRRRRHDRRAAHGAVWRDVDDPRVRRGDRVLERLASHPVERRRPCAGANPRMLAGCVRTKAVERPMHPCHCPRSPPLTYPRSSSVVSPCHIGRGPSRPVSPERTTRHRPINLRADP